MSNRRAVIVSGLRTPFAKRQTAFKDLSAVDLAKLVCAELLERVDLDPHEVDQVAYGQVIPSLRVIASEHTPDAGEERTIAESFVSRAASRVDRWLRQIEENDDDCMHGLARRAYQRGSYGHSL